MPSSAGLSLLYYDRAFGGTVRRVPQGACVLAEQDEVLATLLGSCVAVCLRDRTRGIGGMNHFLMPSPGGDQPLFPAHADHPYGEDAMEHLLSTLLAQGAQRDTLEAKVFGGAEMVPVLEGVGKRNADCALRFLNGQGLTPVAQDLGGTASRRVYFQPCTGKVWVRRRQAQQTRPATSGGTPS
ncbi:chemotaxis protein CheD [Insolitispirillum peregrinum]|uniref:Probable chemoreceptor glutamine deamidase CheD n=1 Tax=Insolitispirillum peregrinum TaxID=80876 RepID=A0A1N7PMP5_9PROT|nr:chemotaxis protein CheD [Insolitispirillum peregrinum]SIT11903.1 chemotaxis protein CheD [Insolitispirillum peregrinum]